MESAVITKLTIPTQPRTTNKLTLCICEGVPDSGSAVHSNSVEYSNCLPEGHLGCHGATRGHRHRTESPHTLVRRPHEEGSMLDTEAGKHTTSLSGSTQRPPRSFAIPSVPTLGHHSPDNNDRSSVAPRCVVPIAEKLGLRLRARKHRWRHCSLLSLCSHLALSEPVSVTTAGD
jgi:hypothetical protein